MQIGVIRESAANERRVALVPDSVGRLVKQGLEVVVQRGAGAGAFFTDDLYAKAGARLADDAASVLATSDILPKIQKPSTSEAAQLREGALVVSLLQPQSSADLIAVLNERRVTSLALERVPRITRAQSMDVLSSQATLAGYKAVLLGASQLGRLLPMLTTAAGNITPSKVFIIGAGVAGLQAIATARRLGGVVSAFDVRPAAGEQVRSLGAMFVAAEVVRADAEAKGGYARAQTEDEQRATQALLHSHLKEMDLVITTAQVPGRRAPVLITDAMLRDMRTGAVVVDVAAEAGGNCEATVAGEIVDAHGVVVMGPLNLPSTVPVHASQMFSRNVLALLQHLVKETSLTIETEEEITRAMLITHDGRLMTAESLVPAASGAAS